MVPNGWKLTSLGEVCSGNLQTGPFGSQLHAHEYTDEGVPVLMPKDLINYRANNATAARIPEHRADDLKKHVLKSGDLLFSRRGDVARFALIESDYPRSLCGTGCLKATPNKAHSPLFLSYFLQKNAVKKWLEQNAVGQTMPNMNTAILAELPIMVASSREEEDKIAKILSTWDKAIATTEKLIETSKQQKKALMQQLLTGKKRLVNPETGKAFEGEWEEVKLGDVAAMNSGGTPKSSVSEYYDGKHPWVSIADMTKHGKWISKTEKSLTDEGIANSSARLYPKGTVLYAMYASIGECSIATVELCSSQAILGIRPNSNLINIYLYYYLINLKEKIILTGQQGTQSNLNAGMVKGFTIKLPIIVEQQKIASVLTAADKEIEALETNLAHFKQEKKALMQQLLTGKRRVKVDDMEAA
ncbi:restriction endonuclease subunit S [Vibrio parahaemolyticus]|nr:restriction endonuclease subunit S [Vibrio parahaemolyticus]